MLHFECDYTEGCHPAILEMLCRTNLEQTAGYGNDAHCRAAARAIRSLCQAPKAAVHFLVGGTQTNTTVISALLRPHQGVLCASSGHINVHETGAIESAGHKVLPLPSSDGKITAGQIMEAYDAHWKDPDHEHLVQPGMVYISHPTENGTIYTKEELSALSAACRSCGLPLFLDGARLGYGLAAPGGDLTLADLARLCDVFYIGGTKVGALFGEAVVIPSPALQKDFRYFIKQRGGMLAKGRLLGIQFETLFSPCKAGGADAVRDADGDTVAAGDADGDAAAEECLYLQISRRAVALAGRLREMCSSCGLPLLFDSPTNQQFPILPNRVLEALEKDFSFSIWSRPDDGHTAVRFCTSWATQTEAVDALCAKIQELCAPHPLSV